MRATPIPWRVIDAATLDLVGRPFERGARGPAAFDCWGLVLEVRRRLALPVPPDYASGELSRAEVIALFALEPRPCGWTRGGLTVGGIVVATSAGHAGVHLAGRVLHAAVRMGAAAWTLGQWVAVYGPLECWDVAEGDHHG